MEFFGVGICALCAVIFGALVKKSNREYAVLIAAGACVLILLRALRELEPLLSQVEGLAGTGGVLEDVLPPVLKAVGVALIGEFLSHLCKDAGESALASAVELAAKVAILAVALPLLVRIFEFLEEIVKL